jgi:hypothetical protein
MKSGQGSVFLTGTHVAVFPNQSGADGKSREYYTDPARLAKPSIAACVGLAIDRPLWDWTTPSQEGECQAVFTLAQSCHLQLLRRSKAPRTIRALRTQIRSAFLPAVATVAAIATAVTPAPATTASASAATTTAPATVPASAPTASTAATLCLGTRFIHNEVSPAKILAVQGVYGLVRVFVIRNFDEGEAARLSREAIANQIYA